MRSAGTKRKPRPGTVPVAAAQYVVGLLLEQGLSVSAISRETGVAVQTINNIRLALYPSAKRESYWAFVKLLGYEPKDIPEGETVAVATGQIRAFLSSEPGRRFVDECRDGVAVR